MTVNCVTTQDEPQVIKGIPRLISVWKISALQLRKVARKGCLLFAIKVENQTLNNIVETIK